LHRPSRPTTFVDPLNVYNARQVNRVQARSHPFVIEHQPQPQRRHDPRISAIQYTMEPSVATSLSLSSFFLHLLVDVDQQLHSVQLCHLLPPG
jgi:hypothetical protein